MELEAGHGPVLTSVRQTLATRNDLRGFPLAAITCLGQRAVIFVPEAAVLDAGPDDETSVFQSAGKRRTALVAYNCALPGNGPSWALSRRRDLSWFAHQGHVREGVADLHPTAADSPVAYMSCSGIATQLISTTASGKMSSVTPTAAHAGYGSTRNSAATLSRASDCSRRPTCYEFISTTLDQFTPASSRVRAMLWNT